MITSSRMNTWLSLWQKISSLAIGGAKSGSVHNPSTILALISPFSLRIPTEILICTFVASQVSWKRAKSSTLLKYMSRMVAFSSVFVACGKFRSWEMSLERIHYWILSIPIDCSPGAQHLWTLCRPFHLCCIAKWTLCRIAQVISTFFVKFFFAKQPPSKSKRNKKTVAAKQIMIT